MPRGEQSRAQAKGKKVPIRWDGPFKAYDDVETSTYYVLSKKIPKPLAKPSYFEIADAQDYLDAGNVDPLKSDFLERVDFYEARTLGCIHEVAYGDLMYEFYCTFAKIDGTSFSCRLRGVELTVTPEVFLAVCGLTPKVDRIGKGLLFPEYEHHVFVKDKRDPQIPMSERLKATEFTEDIDYYHYRFVAQVLCGKEEAGKPNQLECALMWAFKNGREPCIISIIVHHMHESSRDKQSKLGYGPLITALAHYAGVDTSGIPNAIKTDSRVVISQRLGSQIAAPYSKVSSKRARTSTGGGPSSRHEAMESGDEGPQPDPVNPGAFDQAEMWEWMKTTQAKNESRWDLEDARHKENMEYRERIERETAAAKKQNLRHHNRNYAAAKDGVRLQREYRSKSHKEHTSIVSRLFGCFRGSQKGVMENEFSSEEGEFQSDGVNMEEAATWDTRMHRQGGFENLDEGIIDMTLHDDPPHHGAGPMVVAQPLTSYDPNSGMSFGQPLSGNLQYEVNIPRASLHTYSRRMSTDSRGERRDMALVTRSQGPEDSDEE